MTRINTVVWLLLVFIALQGAAVVSAKGPPGVANGKHNLSSSSLTEYATNVSELCVFCHTPHGGSLTGPLWNKPDTTESFTMYVTNSGTELENAGRAVSDESLLCLSCHDGTLSVNSVINVPNTVLSDPVTPFIYTMATGEPLTAVVYRWTDNPVLGTDLSNDHPISFSYDVARANGQNNLKLHVADDAKTAGVRFFGATNYVECSSCHDPHVDYLASPDYAPFLIMPNTGSALCLACHIK